MGQSGERWLCVSTHVGEEFHAEMDLVRRGFSVFAPWQMRARRLGRRTAAVKVGRFPGYIFVKVGDGHSVYHLRQAPGVLSIASRSGAVLPVSESVMAAMRASCTWDGYWPPAEVCEAVPMGPNVGDIIIIEDGPFAGFPGVVERVDERAKVMVLSVSIFGRSTLVEFPLTPVAAPEPAMVG